MTASANQSEGRRKSGIKWTDVMGLLEGSTDQQWDITPQAAFCRITGPQGHRLYVAKQETVRRIDLTFQPTNPDGTVMAGIIPCRKDNGSAKWELDTGMPDALAQLGAIIEWMKTAPAPVVEKRAAFVPSVPKAIAQRRVALSQDPLERQAREERIRRTAREMGVAISPNAEID